MFDWLSDFTVATYLGTIWYTTVNAQQKLSIKQSFSQLLTPYGYFFSPAL